MLPKESIRILAGDPLFINPLFQIFAARLKSLANPYQHPIILPYYMLQSYANHP